MTWWLLLIFIFFVWFLWAVAAAAQVGIENVRHPLPGGQKRGVSIAPVIPIFPLALWAVAMLINRVVVPWGTLVVGSLHAVYAVILVVSIVRDCWRLRSLVSAEQGAAPDRSR